MSSSQRTYMIWLFKQRGRGGPIGDLSLMSFADVNWDGKISVLRKMSKGTIYEPAFLDSLGEFHDWIKEFRPGNSVKLGENHFMRPDTPEPESPTLALTEPVPEPKPKPRSTLVRHVAVKPRVPLFD